MTVRNPALDDQRPRGGPPPRGTLRVAVIDVDEGFLRVLVRRMDAMGWQPRVLAAPVPTDELVAMQLSALVLNLATIAPHGWSYLETVSARLPRLGLIVCTAPSSVAQRVRGLRLGADDWMSKPGHPEELVARVEAVVRRRRRADAGVRHDPVVRGELAIHSDHFQAFVGGTSAELTRREFELVQVLAEGEGQVMQREEIYERVWGYAMAHGDRSVDVHVRKLRQKLERVSPGRRYIHTHFGVGYRFAAEAARGPELRPHELPRTQAVAVCASPDRLELIGS
jgi:DNA-binding response OmpR family regulator